MMKLILFPLFSLALVACSQQDKPNTPAATGQDYDNTKHNARDRDSLTKTPLDQSESKIDRTITQKIRQALMADETLSTNAKNIKIITIDGVVTLRGPVNSLEEKELIIKKLNGVVDIVRVDDQLEAIPNNR